MANAKEEMTRARLAAVHRSMSARVFAAVRRGFHTAPEVATVLGVPVATASGTLRHLVTVGWLGVVDSEARRPRNGGRGRVAKWYQVTR